MATISTALTHDQIEDLVGDITSATILASSTSQITLGLTYHGDDFPHASTLVISGSFPTSDLNGGTINTFDFRDGSNASLLVIGDLTLTTTQFNALLANPEAFEDYVEDIEEALMPSTGFDDHGGMKDDDTYNGTGGDDTVHYDDSSKKVKVSLQDGSSRGQGNDTLIGIENVVGSRGSDDISGSSINNHLDGHDGNDKLHGLAGDDDLFGGRGNDHIDGGDDDDILDGDDGNDKLFGQSGDDDLLGGRGNDHLDGAAGDDTLDGGDGNDKLTGGDGDDDISGGSGNDNIIGGSGVNLLSGEGGNDKITSGDNDDIVDGGDGNDTIMTGGGNDDILGGGGKDNIKAGEGNDTIDGGAGADNMAGGGGDDTYYVDDAKDKVMEQAGQGNDTVVSSNSYSLAKLTTVENIELVGLTDASATGNAANNILIGNDGANTLTGGAGDDTFVFDNLGGVDNITDFGTGNDVLAFDNSVFTSLTPEGPLASANFVLGAAAADANDFMVYDQASGNLYYDVDGNGAGGPELIVQLKAGTTLGADDITVL